MKTLMLVIGLSAFSAHAPAFARSATAIGDSGALNENSVSQPVTERKAKFHLDHATFHVADIEKSAEFYQSLFSLRRVESAVRGLIWLQEERSGFQIHLVPGRELPVQDNQAVHIAFAVDSFTNFLELLNDRHIPWFDSNLKSGSVSRTRSDGVQQIYLRDPDGYWIEVNDASLRIQVE